LSGNLKASPPTKYLQYFPGSKRSISGAADLWSRGYYIGTAGNVSAETIRKYIEARKYTGRG
jgi:REP element-mobilizing transposase RayT